MNHTGTFSIKDARVSDIPLIRNLTFKVWPQTYRDLLSPAQIEYMLELMYSEPSLEKQMAEGCNFLIAFDANEPVGFASYQDLGSGYWKLHKIYVLPQQQGKGTGRYIMDHVINKIKEENAEYLQLQVNRQNKAKDFYEKLGFSVKEEINLDIGNGFFMTDYVMEKKLNR